MSTLLTTNLKNPSSGSNNIVLAADGSTTITTLSSTTITGTTIQGTIKQGTPVASTSGTSIDFTGIPSWVKRVTVMFDGVSTNGSSSPLVQLGTSSGFVTSDYVGSISIVGTGSATVNISTGFLVVTTTYWGAGGLLHGSIVFSLISSNRWSGVGLTSRADARQTYPSAGSVTLSDTLTQLRITTVNGTDTFDAGNINIMYEG